MARTKTSASLSAARALRNVSGVHWFVQREIDVVVWKKAGIAPDHMPVMNGEKIENITRLTATGRRQRFIGCDVDDMQHIAEYIVANRREKTKIAIARPFEPHVLATMLHDGAVNSRFAS
jgi:hypothetical protein